MLEFFRAYQRYFFAFVTVVIIASFSFFGTFSVLERESKREDVQIGSIIDGSPLMLSEIQSLSRFLASDREDVFFIRGHEVPNLCNDGVVRRDFLQAGLADLLVSAYLEPLKDDLSARCNRVKNFSPYTHPVFPMISAEVVWNRLIPSFSSAFAALQKDSEDFFACFVYLSSLYQQQGKLHPEALRRILSLQYRQLSGAESDASLQSADLSLFHFHSLTDWFGGRFLDVVSEFILNAAAVAEQRGYRVTLEEAKGDLLRNFQVSIQKLAESKLTPALSLQQHLRMIGFDERSAASVWRKVLLFRRYFQSISQASFVDRLPGKELAVYTKETAVIQSYQWPSYLRLKTLQDLIEFQTYVSLTAYPLENPLDLPSSYYSPEEVCKKCPELVHTVYKAKVKTISLPELTLKTPIKELWEWQLEEENWRLLVQEFSFLSLQPSREARFKMLELLSSEQRLSVDVSSRLRLSKRHPEWIDEALDAVSASERIFSIANKGGKVDQITNPEQFASVLKKASTGDEAAKTVLLRYSDDEKTIHCFEDVELLEPEHVLSFSEARRLSILASVADRYLQEAYVTLQSAAPFQFKTETGQWKAFSDVKEEVARNKFSDVFQAMKKYESEDGPFAAYRMLAVTQNAMQALKQDPDDLRWIQSGKNDLQSQFRLERKELLLQRKNQENWMKEKAFQMHPHEWSLVQVQPNGDVSFFYLVEKRPADVSLLDGISFGKEWIVADAQLYLADKLLNQIAAKQSIVIPVRGDL